MRNILHNRNDVGVGGIGGGEEISVGAHEIANCRGVAAKLTSDGAVGVALFDQKRSTGAAHITDDTAACRFAAGGAAKVFLEIGYCQGNR